MEGHEASGQRGEVHGVSVILGSLEKLVATVIWGAGPAGVV